MSKNTLKTVDDNLNTIHGFINVIESIDSCLGIIEYKRSIMPVVKSMSIDRLSYQLLICALKDKFKQLKRLK